MEQDEAFYPENISFPWSLVIPFGSPQNARMRRLFYSVVRFAYISMSPFGGNVLRTILLLATFLVGPLASAKGLSLEEIRGQLLNQEVVVLGSTTSLGALSGSLHDWYFVSGDEATGFKRANGYREGSYAPETVRGKRGIVVSIEQAESFLSSKKVGEKDAFGNTIDSSRVMNPYINVVVKVLDDGLLIGTTSYYSVMMIKSLRLASRADSMKKEIDGVLARLIGKTLYKTGYTELLDSALSLQDLLDHNKRKLSRDYKTENLTPLKVVDAKFLEAENAVVIKVELPNGAFRLLFGRLDFYDLKGGYKETILERMKISAVERIPSKFSPKEVAAIKAGNIFRGMSKDALYWSWGYSEKTNDWGLGGEQHIYQGNRYVYVDGKVVRDWQSVE
ncbi:MAG: hypothetical protein Q7S85_05020 [Rugosibacter sp.]|nr:hypothetical protein [Rugosibacter sp.]